VAFEELEHTADWAIKVRGADLGELLANAAGAMLELAGVELDEQPGVERRIEIRSLDRESLLVDFLHELVVALELRQSAFREIQIETDGSHELTATLREVPFLSMAKQIKAVTYNELEIESGPDGLSTTVVFDV
jgi:SHS2 domain-containing protein